jgi:hypothetical protein
MSSTVLTWHAPNGRHHRATLTTDRFGESIIVIGHARPGGALHPSLTLTVTDRGQGLDKLKELHADDHWRDWQLREAVTGL